MFDKRTVYSPITNLAAHKIDSVLFSVQKIFRYALNVSQPLKLSKIYHPMQKLISWAILSPKKLGKMEDHLLWKTPMLNLPVAPVGSM